MILKRRRLLSKIVSIAMIVSIMIADLAGVNQHFVEAKEKQTVYFGNYYQEEVTDKDCISRLDKVDFVNNKATVGGIDFIWKNGHYFYSTPIEWEVLEQESDNYLLISKKILDYHTFTDSIGDNFWHNSDIRTWLNGEFFNSAFSKEERLSMTNITQLTMFYPYADAYINGKDPQYIETSDYVTLLDEDEVQKTAYGYDYGKAETESRVAYTSAYANLDKRAGSWWLRGSGVWNYGNLQEKYISSKGAFSSWYGTYSYGVRPVIRVKKNSKYLSFTKPDDKGVNTAITELQVEKSITAALPDMSNLGSDELKGPEISIGKSKFNLFKTKMNMSLPIFGKNTKLNVKLDPSTHTAEVLLGLEGQIKSDKDDPYWRDTYKQVKSLVQACGGKVDTTKLWNRFSKLRGKLKKISGKAVFGVSGNMAGYMKLQLDENGNIKNVMEGGYVLGCEASGKVKTPLWWIVYSEFGVAGSVDGKLSLTAKNTKTLSTNGEFELAIKPSVALGADAVIVDIKGGLEGKLAGKVKFPWNGFKNSVSAYLTGKLFAKIDTLVPGLSGGWDWNFSKLELYPDLGKVSKNSLKLNYKRSRKATPKGLKEVKTMKKNSVDSLEDSLVYENAKPQMAELPGGRIVMTYLDDTAEDADGQATLMYRIYENGSWGEGTPVNAAGHLDTEGKLKVHNGKLYLLYESSDTAITEDMTETEIIGHMKLYAAEFDATLNRFSTPVLLGKDSGGWKYDYDFTPDGTNLCAVWAENSEKDVLLESGTTKIYQSTYRDGSWQEAELLMEEDSALQEIADGCLGGIHKTAYIKSGKLYIDGEELSAPGEVTDSITFADNYFYFRSDGQLCRTDGDSIEELNIACSADYQVTAGNVYWTEQDNFKSEIYRQPLQGETGAVAVTDDGGYIGSFHVLLKGDGTQNLSYTLQQVADEPDENGNPYGLTLLKVTDDMTRVQGQVENIAYDILSFTPGETNDITVTVSNTGTKKLEQIVLTVYDKGGNVLCEQEMDGSLEPGANMEQVMSVPIPEGISKEDITVTMRASESFAKTASAKAELEVSQTDIEVSEKDVNTIIVLNKADIEAKNVTVKVRNGSEIGTVLYEKSIGTLAAGEKKEISVASLWSRASVNEQAERKYLYVAVSQEDTEYELWNNTTQLEVPAPKSNVISKKPSISPKATNKPARRPAKVTAPAGVKKLTAKNKKKKAVTLSWKKASGAKGYQLQYALNKKFTKKKKSKLTKKRKFTVKKLKKKKTYYFRVRAYKLNGKKKVYGKWSGVKKVKIKK